MKLRARWLATLLCALVLPAASPGRSETRPRAVAQAVAQAQPATGPVHVSMRDVVLYPYDDVPAAVANLSGRMLPEGSGNPIDMDDTASYRIEVDSAEMRLTAAGMTRLMNRHILPAAHTPIRDVAITFGNGTIAMSGSVVKLGAPVFFTATAVLEPTPAGDLRVHPTAMRAGGLVPKGLIDALGLQLDTLAQPANRGVFHIEGDDMIVPVISMFPPPRVGGRLAAVRVTPQGLVAVIGKAAGPAPAAEASSYIAFQGGTINFAKLTMHDTDLMILPADNAAPLRFSPARYYGQLEGGRTEALPNFGLAAYVKQFGPGADSAEQEPPR